MDQLRRLPVVGGKRTSQRDRPAITAGMKVVGCDGQRIGTVAGIWCTASYESDGALRSQRLRADSDAYLMVARAPLFDPLYIPIGQVCEVRQEQVVLPVPAEAIERQGWVGRRAFSREGAANWNPGSERPRSWQPIELS